MKLTKNKIFFGILIFGLIVNLLVFFDIQYLYLRAIFSFIFLITIPGLLIMLMLKIREIGFWEYLVYIIGLSVAFLMFGGLFINWILPLAEINKPLLLVPLLISINILLLIFWIIAYKLNKEILLEIKLPKLDRLNKLFFTIPTIFPILGIFGANILNNQGPNYLTLIMLGGIAVYVFFVVLSRKKLNENIYPWTILMMSISLLLMYSFRSWYISGWDIHQEYQMFQLTKENFHWSMSNFPRNAYNACLSITILPTILSSFLKINDEYIFKLVFQIVFSFVPVIVFLFLRRYTKGIIAFLASFFFISQWQFMQQMPALMRQEISILFFALFLIALFEKNFNYSIKKILLLIFGFSIIISHYSTNYVALILFTFVYFVWLFFRKTENKKVFSKIYQKLNLKEKGRSKREKYYLGGTLILVFFVFTFLWSFQFTKTSDNLIDLIKTTTSNMGKIFTNEIKSEQALLALWGSVKTYTMDDVKNYRDNITKEYHTNKTWINFYSPEKYADYAIEPRYSKIISSPNIKVKIISEYLTKIVRSFLKISILIGIFYLLFSQLKKQKIDAEYIVMSLGCIFLVGIIIIVPYISIGYNIERLFQQTLVLLSLPAVLGILVVFKFLKNKNTRALLIAIIFIWFFLPFSGFNSNIIGGEPQMNLNNFGEEYDRFYTHGSEVKSLEWLSKYYNQKYETYLDRYAILKAYSFPRINEKNILEDILPSTIDKNAYVYSSYTNKINKTTRVNYKNNFLEYNFPTEFLNGNKNKIYNNGGSEIFK
jgi:uncharacterized membrane protein